MPHPLLLQWETPQAQIVMALVPIYARTLALVAVTVLALALVRVDAKIHVKDIVMEAAIDHPAIIDFISSSQY